MRPWFRIAAWFATFTLAFWLFVREHDESLLLAMIAIVAVAVTGTRVHDLVRVLIERDPPPTTAERWFAPVALLIAALICGIVWILTRWSGLGLYTVAIGYMGFGMVVAEWRRGSGSVRWGSAVLAVCALAWVVGVIGVWIAGSGWWFLPLAATLAIGPVGITLVSTPWWPGWGPTPTSAFLVAGIAVTAVAFFVGWWLLGDPALPLVVVVAAVFLMLAVVSRSNVDVLLVVVVGATLWTLTQRDVATPAALTVQAGQPMMVALGDSYISGEGADDFFVQTNAPGVNQCRRAPTAYAVRLVTAPDGDFPRRLAFLACSGADIDGVHAQLEEFRRLQGATGSSPADVSLVVLSAGGNNARFGDIGRICLLPGDCTPLGPAWLAHLDVVRAELDGLYRAVDEQFPDAPIVVVPYPNPIAPNDCDYSAFTEREHAFLSSFTSALDDVVTSLAERHHFEVAPSRDALDGRRLCDGPKDELGVNYVDINSVRGTLEQSTIPLNWVHNSLHPNELGHDLVATTIAAWCAEVDCLARAIRPDVPAEAPPGGGAAIGVLCASDPGADGEQRARALERCAWKEGFRATGQQLAVWGTLVLLALTGPWLIAFAVLRFLTAPGSPLPDSAIPPA